MRDFLKQFARSGRNTSNNLKDEAFRIYKNSITNLQKNISFKKHNEFFDLMLLNPVFIEAVSAVSIFMKIESYLSMQIDESKVLNLIYDVVEGAQPEWVSIFDPAKQSLTPERMASSKNSRDFRYSESIVASFEDANNLPARSSDEYSSSIVRYKMSKLQSGARSNLNNSRPSLFKMNAGTTNGDRFRQINKSTSSERKYTEPNIKSVKDADSMRALKSKYKRDSENSKYSFIRVWSSEHGDNNDSVQYPQLKWTRPPKKSMSNIYIEDAIPQSIRKNSDKYPKSHLMSQDRSRFVNVDFIENESMLQNMSIESGDIYSKRPMSLRQETSNKRIEKSIQYLKKDGQIVGSEYSFLNNTIIRKPVDKNNTVYCGNNDINSNMQRTWNINNYSSKNANCMEYHLSNTGVCRNNAVCFHKCTEKSTQNTNESPLREFQFSRIPENAGNLN